MSRERLYPAGSRSRDSEDVREHLEERIAALSSVSMSAGL